MSVSIIACPSCKSLVLPDTAQCPNCNFVFDEKRALVEPPTIGHVEPTEEEIPCPGCNELVKKGLVRCWNCGTFMQSHIAETYKRMQNLAAEGHLQRAQRGSARRRGVLGDDD